MPSFFQRLFRAKPPQASLRNPDAAFLEALHGAVSLSGARVTQDSVLGVATVFACVSLLSRIISTLPLKLYERREINGHAGKAEAVKHPVYDLLAHRPNPVMTSADVRGALMANLALRGNAYALIIRDRGGRPREIWPIHGSRVTVKTSVTNPNDIRYHIANWQGGTSREVPFGDMIHIRGLSFTGIDGIGPMTAAREAIGLAIVLEENASQFFGNQSRPGMILESTAPLTEQQIKAILDQIKKEYTGKDSAYKTLILNGMKLAAGRTPNDTAQFDESRSRQASEICKLFGVPPHKVGILDKATFSNIEHQQIQFVVDTIGPLCEQWEQALAGALLSVEERSTHFLKHNLNALLRGDFKTRVEGYVAMITNGIMSPNEVRSLEDMDAREGGDVYLTPLNMAMTGKDARADDAAEPPPPKNRINGHHHEHLLS